jgi:serine phosphatase RsbU (regulator of sigma subunit)
MATLAKMESVPVNRARLVEWSVASRPMRGERVCGDLHLVTRSDDTTLLAVIDGIGHGGEAAAAAQAAVKVLREHAKESAASLIERCHKALIHTRGVVMTLATVQGADNSLTWLGVGNVEGRLLRADTSATHRRESVLLRGGLVGYQLPPLQASVLPVAVGDLLIFTTDGIEPTFENAVRLGEAPARIAAAILERHNKESDDALVLVARYLGRSA